MNGMQNPNYDDLIDCLDTLSQFSGADCVPTAYLDLYYHALDLATVLDEGETASTNAPGLAFLVSNRAFGTAKTFAREKSGLVTA